MATWKDVPGLNKFVYEATSGPGDGDDNKANGKVAVKLQYDADSVTTTSMKVRFYGWSLDGVNYLDSFYILYDPSDTRVLYLVKYYYKSYTAPYTWPAATSSFTLYKDATAPTYALKDFWICNDGYAAAEGSSSWKSGKTKAENFYNIFGSGWRTTHVSKHGKRSVSITGISGAYLTNVGAVAPTITDNYNNSYTIVGTKGTNGTNNTVTGNNIYYTSATGSEAYTPSWNTATKTVTVNFSPTDNQDTKTVSAYVKTYSAYNNKGVQSSTIRKEIRQYIQPSIPGKPVLSWTKSRLTIKESLTYEWPKATARNKYSPVMGYRLRLYKNGVLVNISNTTTASVDPYFDTDVGTLKKGFSLIGQDDPSVATVKLTFDPAVLGFVPKDKIKLEVLAYSRYGEKDKETNSGSQIFNQTVISSDELIIQNAGIVRVFLSGRWKEGTAFVRLNNKWVEVETVNARVSSNWKESE